MRVGLTDESAQPLMRTMAGIVSYGSYIPYRRLKRAAIAQMLGVAASKGERSVASFDEDSASMAVEAVRDALKAAPAASAPIGALIFATTTPPYGEKLNAAIVAAATRMPPNIRAVDLTGSVRAGISAILQGADAASRLEDQRDRRDRRRAPGRTRGQGRAAKRRRRGRLRARNRERHRGNRSHRVADPRVHGHLARARRALWAFVGRTLHADAGVLAAFGQSDLPTFWRRRKSRPAT